MSLSSLTPGQRRTVGALAVLVIAVSAMLTGFIITSTQRLKSSVPAPTATLAAWPPTPQPTDEPSPVSYPEDDGLLPQVRTARLFEQIAYQVETLRGLPPRGEVPLSFLGQEEIAALVAETYSAQNLEAQMAPYVLLGLLPQVAVTVRPRPVAGVYLPEQGQLFIASDRQNDDPDNQALLARAYGRALQDQHFDLSTIDARAPTTDAALAARALVEGDALLLMALYRYQELAATDWDHLVEVVDRETPTYGDPLDQIDAWRRLRLFPLREGRELVQALFQTGGWDAVNRAYADLPRSTEQVLHRERYLQQERDVPSSIVVPDVGEVLGSGWLLRRQDTLGEFATGLYLETALPDETARQAATGWDGDTLAVWEDPDGRQALIWRTVWDTTRDAAESESALTALIQQRFVPAWPLEGLSGGGRWWETEGGFFHLERAGRHVSLVRAPTLDLCTAVVEAVP